MMMMKDDTDSTLSKVQLYREIVLQYEELDAAIDTLIMAAEGKPENLSPEELSRYRNLAFQRDELQHQMRWLEHQLLDDSAAR